MQTQHVPKICCILCASNQSFADVLRRQCSACLIDYHLLLCCRVYERRANRGQQRFRRFNTPAIVLATPTNCTMEPT